jgi:hypothetical protein
MLSGNGPSPSTAGAAWPRQPMLVLLETAVAFPSPPFPSESMRAQSSDSAFSPTTLRGAALGFALLFALVVALGFIPSLNGGMDHVAMSTSGEHMMMGLYMIGPADDVTHGLTAVAFLVAGLLSAKWSRAALTAFGWYYAIDAAIYLVTGVIQHRPAVSNVMLNLPHVILSGTMLWLAYRTHRDAAGLRGPAMARAAA